MSLLWSFLKGASYSRKFSFINEDTSFEFKSTANATPKDRYNFQIWRERLKMSIAEWNLNLNKACFRPNLFRIYDKARKQSLWKESILSPT